MASKMQATVSNDKKMHAVMLSFASLVEPQPQNVVQVLHFLSRQALTREVAAGTSQTHVALNSFATLTFHGSLTLLQQRENREYA